MRPLICCLFAGLFVVFAAADRAAADPEHWTAEGWKTDFTKTSVDLGEIMSGGVPRDGIPPIDKPVFSTVKEAAERLTPAEPVIALSIEGDSRAYPLSILIWHEIVNDTVGGMPVAVTYCPLCDAAVVFDRRVDGRTLDFGTTGKLRNSDLVMWDRQTESWWQQFLGEAIVGVHLGKALKFLPSRVESFERFEKRHPDGKVLKPGNPSMRPYGQNPYAGYDGAPWPFLYRGDFPGDQLYVAPLDRVIMVGEKAWTLGVVKKAGTIKDDDMEITWVPGQVSVLDSRDIASGQDIGNVVVKEKQADGTMADAVHDVTFAFAFHAFKPEGAIIVDCGAENKSPPPKPLVCN